MHQSHQLTVLIVGLDLDAAEIDPRRHYLPRKVPTIPSKRLRPHLAHFTAAGSSTHQTPTQVVKLHPQRPLFQDLQQCETHLQLIVDPVAVGRQHRAHLHVLDQCSLQGHQAHPRRRGIHQFGRILRSGIDPLEYTLVGIGGADEGGELDTLTEALRVKLDLHQRVGVARQTGINRCGESHPDRVAPRRQLLQRLPLRIAEEPVVAPGEYLVKLRRRRRGQRLLRIQQRRRLGDAHLPQPHARQFRRPRRHDQDLVEAVAHAGVGRIRLGRPDEIRKRLRCQRVYVPRRGVVRTQDAQVRQPARQAVLAQDRQLTGQLQRQWRRQLDAQGADPRRLERIFGRYVDPDLDKLARVGRGDRRLVDPAVG